MENQKKRSNASCEKKSKKKIKIETAADAVEALDYIDINPLLLPVKNEEIPVTGQSKIPSSFFDNHVKMKYALVGEVYVSCRDHDNSDPLDDDIKSLILSHEKCWKLLKRLKEKCLELKGECLELMRQNRVLISTAYSFPSS